MLTDPFCSSEVGCSRDFGLWVLVFKHSTRVFGARGHMNFSYRFFFLRWRNENRELGVNPLLMDSWDCLMILGGNDRFLMMFAKHQKPGQRVKLLIIHKNNWGFGIFMNVSICLFISKGGSWSFIPGNIPNLWPFMFCSGRMGGKYPTMSQKPKDLCLFDWKTLPTKTYKKTQSEEKFELVLDPPSYRLMKGTGAKKKGPHFPARPLGLFLASWHILLYRKPWNGVNRRWGGVDLAVKDAGFFRLDWFTLQTPERKLRWQWKSTVTWFLIWDTSSNDEKCIKMFHRQLSVFEDTGVGVFPLFFDRCWGVWV